MVRFLSSTGLPPSPTSAARSGNQQDGRSAAAASGGAGGSSPQSASPATVTVLSDAAAALAKGGQSVSRDFDEMVQRRTDALASRMQEAFKAEMIRTDEPIAMRVDRYGTITVDGPQKKKIEKLMRDDPELAKEFRDVASLNTARAVAEALRLHAEELKSARNPKERREAGDRFAVRSATIQDLSGSMTLKDGKLISAARVYAQSLSDPPADGKAIAARMAEQKTNFLV